MTTGPKFGSFKRRSRIDVTKDEEAEAQGLSPSGSSQHEHDGTKRREIKSSNSDRLHRSLNDSSLHSQRSNESEHRHHSSQKRAKPAQSARPHEESQPAESDLFLIDGRGDPKNVEFGSLHRYSVPSYHKVGYGRVLGAPPDIKIDRDASTTTEVVLLKTERLGDTATQPSLSSKHLRLPKERQLHIWKSGKVDSSINGQEDFISLRNSASLKRKRDSETQESRDGSTTLVGPQTKYTIDDLVSDSSEEELGVLSEADESLDQDQPDKTVRAKNAALIRQTTEHPEDAGGWLALIDHQAEVFRSNQASSEYSSMGRRSLAEIRLSIYRKALKNTTSNNAGHLRLLVGMLEQGMILWDSSTMASEWRKTIDSQSYNIDLWSRYLAFLQTNSNNFQAETVRDEFIRGLHMYQADGMENVTPTKADFQSGQLYLFLRLTCFLRDTGYDELSIALWQILLESQLFKPSALIDRTDAAFWEELETFWESEVPRIGEEGARGWAAFRSESIHATVAQRPGVTEPHTSHDPLTAFTEHEMVLSGKLHLPARATDDDASSDPFLVVMFSDMDTIIRPLNHAFNASALIDAYLCFLGLPALPDLDTFRWRTSPFCYVSTNGNGTDFVRPDSWTIFQDFPLRNPTAGDPNFLHFVDRTISRLADVCPLPDALAQYHIAFRAKVWPDTAPKFAKSLIKQSPTSLGLYNAYALLEASQGRTSKANEVWATALTMSSSLGKKARQQSVVLVQSWTKTSIYRLGDEAGGLQCLLAMSEGSPDVVSRGRSKSEVSAPGKLRATQTFAATWDSLLQDKQYDCTVSLAECHMWLDYLAEDHSLERAMHLIQAYADQLAKKAVPTSATELLLQHEAAMISYHIERHRPYAPAVLLNQLRDNIRLFPSNTMLTRLYAEVNASFRMNDHLRQSLDGDLLTGSNATVAGWSVAIARELRHYRAGAVGTTSHAVRALFRKALLTAESTAKHTPALWVDWLQFEQSMTWESSGGKQGTATQRLKQVILYGLRHLPWYKHWITLSMHVLTCCDDVRKEELQQLYDVLIERGLRVRAPAIDVV